MPGCICLRSGVGSLFGPIWLYWVKIVQFSQISIILFPEVSGVKLSRDRENPHPVLGM